MIRKKTAILIEIIIYAYKEEPEWQDTGEKGVEKIGLDS